MKQKYYKISVEGSGQHFIADYKNLAEYIKADLEGANDGSKLIVEMVEMTEKKYESLPEFEGW